MATVDHEIMTLGLARDRLLDRSVELFCDNLRRFASGEPLLNVVDPNAGY